MRLLFAWLSAVHIIIRGPWNRFVGLGGEANIVGLNIISKNSVRKLDCMEKQNLTQLWLLGYRYVVSCQEDKKETYLQTTLFFYYDQ